MAEAAANGTLVIDLNDANTGNDTDLDGESLAYSITAGNGAGVFAIAAATGGISVADNTSLDFAATPQYVLSVEATDGTTPASASVTVDVSTVINENAPQLNNVTTSVTEAAANGTLVIDLNDANTGNDTDLDGEPLAYSITAGNGAGVFAIAAATGSISVADNTSLDFGATPQYVPSVEDISDGTTPAGASVTVDVSTVINENAPQLNNVTTSVTEAAANGTLVIDLNDANTGK